MASLCAEIGPFPHKCPGRLRAFPFFSNFGVASLEIVTCYDICCNVYFVSACLVQRSEIYLMG